MRLQSVRGDARGKNTYCGPAALAAVFGISTRVAAAHLRMVSGRKNIFGVHEHHLEAVMVRLGGDVHVVEEVEHLDGLMRPFHGSLERLAPLLDGGIYIVSLTHHYVALDASRMEVCDNHTKDPMPLSTYQFRRARVKYVWWIREIAA
jgi:hypothetical protein